MNNSNLVLLARPSFFIVNEMQSFIGNSGYDPQPLKTMEQLEQLNAPQADVKGAVISTAVRSDVSEDYVEVVKRIRDKYPELPIAFATLVEFETIAKAVRLKLEGYIANPELLSMEQHNTYNSKLGNSDTFLIIHKNDLTDDAGRAVSEQIIKRHFS